MKNIEYHVIGDILTITVDLSKSSGPSTSGKSIIIASSEGNQELSGAGGAVLGMNLYRKNK